MTVQLICCSHSPLMTTDVEESEQNVHAQFFQRARSPPPRRCTRSIPICRGVRARSFQRLLLRADAGVLHRHLGRRDQGLASRKRPVAGAARARSVLRALPAGARFRRRDLASDEGRSRHHHPAATSSPARSRATTYCRSSSIALPIRGHRSAACALLAKQSASFSPSQDMRITRRRLGRPVARPADAAARHEPARRGAAADRSRRRRRRTNSTRARTASSRRRATWWSARACLPPSEQWDRDFLDTFLGPRYEDFDRMTDEEIDRVAGFGAHEVRTWVAAAAAARKMGDVQCGAALLPPCAGMDHRHGYRRRSETMTSRQGGTTLSRDHATGRGPVGRRRDFLSAVWAARADTDADRARAFVFLLRLDWRGHAHRRRPRSGRDRHARLRPIRAASPTRDYKLETLGADVIAVLDHLGWRRRC